MNYYAGLDIGGTNGRLKISNEEGTVLGEFQALGCSVNTDGYEKSGQRCRELVMPNLALLGLEPADCKGICAAISGVDSPSDASACRRIFEEMGFLKQNLTIVNDCEVFLYLSKVPSLVVISGTGSICYGRDAENRIFRTGGWNHIISDEGSGFELGLRFLEAVANDLDGRKSAPLLTSMIVEESGLDAPEKINEFVNENLFEKSQIARFAKIGYEAAKQGDPEAMRIHRECADKLYSLIEDTFSKMDHLLQAEADLWLWGSVLVKNDIIQGCLEGTLKSKLPSLKIQIPQVSALDTALNVAMSAGVK